MALTTDAEIRQQLKTIYADWKNQGAFDFNDLLTEYIDGLIPIYTNDIIAEWVEMPNEFDDLGAAEFGSPDPVSITKLMEYDLYNYYHQTASRIWAELVDEMEEGN